MVKSRARSRSLFSESLNRRCNKIANEAVYLVFRSSSAASQYLDMGDQIFIKNILISPRPLRSSRTVWLWVASREREEEEDQPSSASATEEQVCLSPTGSLLYQWVKIHYFGKYGYMWSFHDGACK